jgi:NADPH2:quinone reductase
MRAFAVRSFGEPASVQDLPVPAADGAALVRVRFAGINPLDSNLLGRLTAASSYPFVVGIDFAGVAERVPDGEHGLRAGDRVFGMARTHGAYAEYTAVALAARMEPVAWNSSAVAVCAARPSSASEIRPQASRSRPVPDRGWPLPGRSGSIWRTAKRWTPD